MRLTRVFVDAAFAPGGRVLAAGDAAAHLTRVLRLGAGDAVTVWNGDGYDYPARIVGLRGAGVEIGVLDRAAARAESPLPLRLVQGVARGERMDLIVQKATELGVVAIQPVLTARSVVRLDARTAGRRLAHWRGVIVAACEQCGRARLPAIEAPLPLADWLAHPTADGVRRLQLALDARTSLAAAAAGAAAVELLVGPEGGLDAGEHDAAARAGYRPVGLGPRVLRTETAALAALALVQAVAGDFR